MKQFKTLLSYVTILFIIIFYMLYLDGKSGIIMLTFFIIVPLVSFVLTLLAKKNLDISLVCDETNIEKNHSFTYSLNVKKKSFLPVPFVTVKLYTTPHIDNSESDTICFSMPVKKEMNIENVCNARYCGNGAIFIESVYTTDYLNIFSLKIPQIKSEHRVEILPEIHEIDSLSTVFRAVTSTVSIDENDEESDNASVFGISAFAGYEHRDYIPGDSIKRINWKMFANKGKLMIRLDEKMPAVRPEIVLNFSEYNDYKEECIAMRERITEGCLSFAYFCIRNGIECNISYSENNDWKTEKMKSLEDIRSLAVKLSSIINMDNHNVIPENLKISRNSTSTVMIFMPEYSEKIKEQIDNIIQNGNSAFIICGDDNAAGENVWYINEMLEILERNNEQ